MNVSVLPVGPVSTNCYILSKNGFCIVIDPGDRSDLIIRHIKDNNLTCQAILLTHGHFDHISAVDDLCAKYGVDCYIHENDAVMFQNPLYNASYYFGFQISLKQTPHCFTGDANLSIGDFEIQVIETPGHSNGSVCYVIDNMIFCGDLLFKNSCGRTDLHGGSVQRIISSIRKIIEKYPLESVVYSGHDEPFTIKEAIEENYIIVNYKLAKWIDKS